MAKPSCLTPSEDYTEELTDLTCKESIKAPPAAPMVSSGARQVGWRASEAPDRGAPLGGQTGWVAGGSNMVSAMV